MARKRSSLFLNVNADPSPDTNPTLWEHRLRQRRPISRNPFEPDNEPNLDYGLPTIDSPRIIQHQGFDLGQGQPSDKTNESSKEELAGQKGKKNHDIEWGEQIPKWLNLFFDLAWTATFASLTSNNKFREPWDSISYIVFFTTAWWLWVSQVSYNVDFYTDDWFHLVFIFLQLIIFGALAATTRGYDVSTYILHSPGSQELETYDIATTTPERFSAERLTKLSVHVILFIFAFSRTVLLIQHIRVLVYAKLTSTSGRFPRRLLIVPASLAISAALFYGALATTLKPSGLEPYGAKVKYILWSVALFVEVVAHIIRFNLDIDHGVRLLAHGSITERLNDITTIILGEGINAIAGVFYAIEQAPGFKKSTGAAIVCCGIIVFFLAYLYFEGPAPLKCVRRRAAWMMMHLPWLLSVILLLEGVKNQLLLSSFFGSVSSFIDNLVNVLQLDMDDPMFNTTLRPLLLQSGLTLDNEFNKLYSVEESLANQNLTDDELQSAAQNAVYTWILRVQLSGVMSIYRTFMENDTIPEGTYKSIQQYLTNDSYTNQASLKSEVQSVLATEDLPILYQIIEELLHPSLTNARYIMALSGLTFICLGILNLIQSWPRDRFQWGSIFSRFAMGASMFLLLLLNIGKYQKYNLLSTEDPSQQVAVFRWADASWVLPTIALAYAIQFIVDTVLVYVSIWYGKKQINRDVVQAGAPERKI